LQGCVPEGAIVRSASGRETVASVAWMNELFM
jgi:hypothetical protein